MLFQDSSCVAVVSFRDFKKKGLYDVLHADACAILAVSNRYRKVKIEGIDAWNGMEPQFCQTLCQTYREEIWAAEGARNLFDEGSGTSMAVIHLHTQQRFKAFVIFFRRSQPFPPSELSWAKRFMDLYYEKVLLFNDLYQANEYINHIFEGAEFPILIFDNNGELISLNLYACEIFHLQQPKEFHRYQAGNDSFFAMLRQVAATNRKRHADGMAFAMEDGVLHLNLSMSPIHNTKGVVVGVSALCRPSPIRPLPPPRRGFSRPPPRILTLSRRIAPPPAPPKRSTCGHSGGLICLPTTNWSASHPPRQKSCWRCVWITAAAMSPWRRPLTSCGRIGPMMIDPKTSTGKPSPTSIICLRR